MTPEDENARVTPKSRNTNEAPKGRALILSIVTAWGSLGKTTELSSADMRPTPTPAGHCPPDKDWRWTTLPRKPAFHRTPPMSKPRDLLRPGLWARTCPLFGEASSVAYEGRNAPGGRAVSSGSWWSTGLWPHHSPCPPSPVCTLQGATGEERGHGFENRIPPTSEKLHQAVTVIP